MSAHPSEVLVAYVTVPSREFAESIGTSLVESGDAACVNVLPQVTSFFKWQGKFERYQEYVMILKTTREAYARMQSRILDLHPSDNPCILALPVADGSPAFLDWVEQATQVRNG
ncbi:MAG: divalent-cation tolerance protein CutA [Alphaproteobacteria bacterium]|nr:divalent-cation tolerance protein CutA [Alphaproteobacteria bacterium]